MAFKFQYNKIYLQSLEKALKVRLSALPTLKAKEAALRLEVKKAREETGAIRNRYEDAIRATEPAMRLFGEVPEGFLEMEEIRLSARKIAGIKIPILEGVRLSEAAYSLFAFPGFFPKAKTLLESILKERLALILAEKKASLLEHARKKTTQKVNLYEKVQVPELQESLRKIRRFLEDQENLSKSSQKMLKAKLALA